MRTSSAFVKAGLGDGEGSIAILETMLEPTFEGPGPHRHLRTVDSFFVLEGGLSLTVDGQSAEIAAGGYAAVPPGSVHTFANRRDETVRLLNVMAPAGLEGYLREVAEEADAGASEAERAAGMVAKYDFQIVR